ncbi:MAG: cation-efflux pump [Thermoplasmata archaeon]
MQKDLSSGKLIALISIIVNIALFGTKGFIGLGVGSLALIADSLHSFSDSASSLAVYFGLRIAEKPPDESHPFGHGRAEHVALLAVGLMLLIAALKFLTDGAMALVGETKPIKMSFIFYVIVGITALIKEIMAEASYIIGKKLDSGSLKADAWHHRSDALTTVLVLASIYATHLGFPFLDPIAGIGISILLGYIGINYVKKSTYKLLGTAPTDELVEKIRRTSSELDGVQDVHDIKVHDYGRDKAISLHMTSEPGVIRKAHEISHKLQETLEDKFEASVEVHLDPWSPPESEIKRIIDETITSHEQIKEAHKIKVSESKNKILISMHILVPQDETVEKAHHDGTDFEENLKDALSKNLKIDSEIQVHIEPCEGDCEGCEVECKS